MDGIRAGISENFTTNNHGLFMDIGDENLLAFEKIRKYSTEEIGINEPELRKRTLSIVMDRINHIGKN